VSPALIAKPGLIARIMPRFNMRSRIIRNARIKLDRHCSVVNGVMNPRRFEAIFAREKGPFGRVLPLKVFTSEQKCDINVAFRAMNCASRPKTILAYHHAMVYDKPVLIPSINPMYQSHRFASGEFCSAQIYSRRKNQ